MRGPMRRSFYIECTRSRFCIARGEVDFTLESAMSSKSRLYFPKPSQPSIMAAQHFGTLSEPEIGLVQINEFINHPEWTYAH